MKKTFTFILVSLFLATSIFAGPIDQEKAFEIASSFWNSNPKFKKGVQLQPVHADKASKAPSRDNTTANDAQYYIFSSSNNCGFVIVSGDDKLTPIVGYSDNGNSEEMPPALVEWLAEYSSYVNDVRAGVVEPTKTTATAGTRIEPMLKTSWNQSAPYNNYCPEVNGQKTPTGCTATAMAQIMKFHEWPAKATRNVTWTSNITGETETVDLTSHSYRWSDMLEHYRNGYTPEQADAVAQLMIDVGKAIQSSYSPSGTGSSDIFVSHALVNVFDYSPETRVIRRAEYTEEEYVAIIRDNLEAGLPLLYSGMSQSYASGHAFVCDGIDENNMLHIDWGWDGAYNGYFDMTTMAPGGAGIGGGADRYNVGQTLVANIQPRKSDEPGIEGEPTVYMLDVVDVFADLENNETPETLSEQSIYYDDKEDATIRFAAGLLNWSHSSAVISMVVGIEKNGEPVKLQRVTELTTMKFNGDGMGYYITIPISKNQSSSDYLEKGTYNIRIYYSDIKNNTYLARGAENGLILEVEENSVTISKELPEATLSGVTFHQTPQMKGDKLALDARFKTTNGKSATVLIVPVVNRLLADGTISSTIISTQALIQIYDDRDIAATFNTSYTFPEDGEYYISFKYNLKNNFTDRSTTVDYAKLIEIDGKSEKIVIKSEFEGAQPSTTSISAVSTKLGENLNVSATVKNITTTSDSFTGTLALVVANNSTGKEHILAKAYIEELAMNATTKLSYNQPDYAPAIGSGSYTAYVCELKNGKLEKISQSAATCQFTIGNNVTATPYADGRIVINDGIKVRQGSPFTAKTKLSSTNGNFDGYIKVTIKKGLNTVIESEYIAVSLKEGVTTDIDIECTCKSSTSLGQYKLTINYYDSSKNKLGTVSNNTLAYPDNGYFWVADVTAIDDVRDNGIDVGTNGNSIIVSGAENAEITIYSVDGKEVYNGRENTVAVERGMYIIAVQTPGNKPYTTKVFVK